MISESFNFVHHYFSDYEPFKSFSCDPSSLQLALITTVATTTASATALATTVACRMFQNHIYQKLVELDLSDCQLTQLVDVNNCSHENNLTLCYEDKPQPPDVSKYTQLVTLNLGHNQLMQPPDVSNNTKLTNFFLFCNQLTQPPDVSNNTQLINLCLSQNQLTQPPYVSNNTQLRHLNLSHNQLTQLPDVSNNAQLRHLNLSQNQLTQPPDVSNNTQLTELDLSYNQLSELHDSILSLPSNCNVFAGSNRFSAAYVEAFLTRLLQHRLDHPSQGPLVYLTIYDESSTASKTNSLEKQLRFWSKQYKIAFPKDEAQEDVLSLLNSFDNDQKKTLALFLNKLEYIQDYQDDGEARKNVILRVNHLLQLATSSSEFKDYMMAFIIESLETCGDRALIIFNDLEIAWNFAHKELAVEEFRNLVIRESRYERLKQHAQDECVRLKLGDQIEAILYFHIKLRDSLDLPITTKKMLYEGCSGVTEKMLSEGYTKISSIPNKVLLVTSPRWQKHIEKQKKMEFTAVRVKFTDLLEKGQEYSKADDKEGYLQKDRELSEFFKENPSSKPMSYLQFSKFLQQKREEALQELCGESE